MDMTRYISIFLAMLVSFVAIDVLWIGVIMQGTYQTALGHLITGEFYLPAVAVFYPLYIAGLMIFAVFAHKGSLRKTFIYGAAFGLVAYGTYDLTNHATLPQWPLIITVLDMLWGAFISGLVSLIGGYVLSAMRPKVVSGG